jgi:glycogen debranching enzyme/putative sterol carrier protein
VPGDQVSILDGNTFVVSDRNGDIDASPSEPAGLFHRDTRFLSRWRLTLDGEPLTALSTDDLHYFSAQFFLVPGSTTVYTEASLSVIRKRSVGQGFHEDVTVLNHGAEALEVELQLAAAADFADLFEVKDALAKKGELTSHVGEGELVLSYRRERFARATRISATAPEAEVAEDGLRFRIRLEPHGEWTTCIDVVAALDGLPGEHERVKYAHGEEEPRPNVGLSLRDWLAGAPTLDTDWETLARTYERTLVDLAALRFYALILPDRAIPAAGLPWFMTIFGRDSIITSYQALPFTPELAVSTLLCLAARQGRRVDEFRDEEPGKILHELRFGELTAFEERPHSPYYGSADATPLFLVLLDEHRRWTGSDELARELETPARAALGWIDEYGDRDGDGYVEYERGAETGLENQCWKDSWNSILFADGSMSSLPRACCEIQGYVYDAKVRCAGVAREVWRDPELADRLEREAAELKRRFNEDFWVGERECFALALDGEKRRVDSVTSNIGHLLWSGIVEDEKVGPTVRHLLGERLFSGWGVRTMAEGEGGYNPLGYHVGTVWPHDNSLIALGLARHGYREEAARLAEALVDAAGFFRYRLPEAFAGYPRGLTRFPVEYPTACSPQAWAAAAPLALIRAVLALEPAATGYAADPVLPAAVSRLELRGAPARARRPRGATLAAARSVIVPVRDGAVTAASAREVFTAAAARLASKEVRFADATCCVDLGDAGSWIVEVRDGRASVREGRTDADLVLRTSEDVFLGIIRGDENPITALMSGRLELQGQPALAPVLQQLIA